MNILRMTLVCVLLWGAGLQYAKAGDWLSKEDSLALVKMYQDYMDAKNKAAYEEDEEEIEALKLNFEASLASNPRFAEVVRLRNLLKEYQSEKNAFENELGSEESEDVDFESIGDEWRQKFIELIRNNPKFIDYPECLFEEIDNISVFSSSDGQLRYYYYNYFPFRQYRTKDGKVVVSWDEKLKKSDYYSNSLGLTYYGKTNSIYILNLGNKVIYLIHNEGLGVQGLFSSLHAEAIEGQEIIHPHIFEQEDENGDLSFFSKINNRKEWLQFVKESWLIRYNENTRTIDVRDLNFLDKSYITYSFNGEKFVKSSYENVDYSIKEIVSYIEERVFFEDPKTLFDKPLEILGYFNDEKFAFSDKTLVEEMKRRIERKEPIAHILYLRAAEKGDVVAQYKLGNCYFHGYMGVGKDVENARIWLQKAADQGHSLAQRCLYDNFHDSRYKGALARLMNDSPEKQHLTEDIQQFVEDSKESKKGWDAFTKYSYTNRYYSLFRNVWEENYIEFLWNQPKTLFYPGKEMEKLFRDTNMDEDIWPDFKVITSQDGMLRSYCWNHECSDFLDYSICVFQFLSDVGRTFLQSGYNKFDAEKRSINGMILEYLRGVNKGLKIDSIYNYYDISNDFYDIYSGKKKYSLDEMDECLPWAHRSMVTNIYQMDTDNGRIYLVKDFVRVETNAVSKNLQNITACIINNGTLYRIPIFLEYGRNLPRIECRIYRELNYSDDYITFDEASKTITIQQYDKDEDGNYKRLDDIVYKFDGQFFRQVK